MQYLKRQEHEPEAAEDRRLQERQGEQRRRSPRQRTLLSGYVLPLAEGQPAEVVVRNLSDTGARMSLKGPAPRDGEFLICIPTRSIATAAKVVWSETSDLGVQFEAPGAEDTLRLANLMSSLKR